MSSPSPLRGLNNLLQPKRSPAEAAAKLNEAMKAASLDEQTDEKESWASTQGLVGPFSMATLQAAEAESREEAGLRSLKLRLRSSIAKFALIFI